MKLIDRNKFYSILEKYLRPGKSSLEIDNSPIVSSLLNEEPDIADLLQGFIERLPVKIAGIRSTLERQNKEELARQVHDLKGVSGNYGYNVLFELCQRMEFEINANRLLALHDMLDLAEKIVERIRLGLPDSVVPMTRNQDGSGKTG